ncbi:DNA-binding protein snt1 [Malassezia sp. CBS 17886]|nr:DNA-binding protein snt1 [Malassezia sp. CBS 17886]
MDPKAHLAPPHNAASPSPWVPAFRGARPARPWAAPAGPPRPPPAASGGPPMGRGGWPRMWRPWGGRPVPMPRERARAPEWARHRDRRGGQRRFCDDRVYHDYDRSDAGAAGLGPARAPGAEVHAPGTAMDALSAEHLYGRPEPLSGGETSGARIRRGDGAAVRGEAGTTRPPGASTEGQAAGAHPAGAQSPGAFVHARRDAPPVGTTPAHRAIAGRTYTAPALQPPAAAPGNAAAGLPHRPMDPLAQAASEPALPSIPRFHNAGMRSAENDAGDPVDERGTHLERDARTEMLRKERPEEERAAAAGDPRRKADSTEASPPLGTPQRGCVRIEEQSDASDTAAADRGAEEKDVGAEGCMGVRSPVPTPTESTDVRGLPASADLRTPPGVAVAHARPGATDVHLPLDDDEKKGIASLESGGTAPGAVVRLEAGGTVPAAAPQRDADLGLPPAPLQQDGTRSPPGPLQQDAEQRSLSDTPPQESESGTHAGDYEDAGAATAAPSPAVREAVEALAAQLLERFPLTQEHIHAIVGANRELTASVATPGALAYCKEVGRDALGDARARAKPTHDCAREQRVLAYLEAELGTSRAAFTSKIAFLRDEYRAQYRAWLKYCERLGQVYERREQQRHASQTGAGDGDAPPANGSVLAPALATPASTSRTHRRGAGPTGFSDTVRSEAEFLEILASLENAEMQDPVARAARTAATIPDMVLRADRDEARTRVRAWDDDNGYMADSMKTYFGGFDPDVWSEEETATFARHFAQHPKQFGRIAAALPHKTMQQCVAYYYLHKHQDGCRFKELGAARSRERKRKAKPRKKAKGSALLTDLASSAIDDADTDDRPTDAETPAAPKTAKRGRSEDHGAAVPMSGAVETPRPRTTSAKRAKSAARSVRRADSGDDVEPDDDVPHDSYPAPPSDAQQTEMARDLAAAEALEALAGIATPTRDAQEKKPRARAGGAKKSARDGRGEEVKSRSRGPHWSMTERAQFLRLLALHGKDWTALAAALPPKTAAQTRNFFARHASESTHFQSAAALAVQNAALPWEQRVKAAVAFVNAWYMALPDDAKSTIAGWPVDVAESHAAFLPQCAVVPADMSADDDETDDEDAGAHVPQLHAPWADARAPVPRMHASAPGAYGPSSAPRYYARETPLPSPSPYAPPPVGMYGYGSVPPPYATSPSPSMYGASPPALTYAGPSPPPFAPRPPPSVDADELASYADRFPHARDMGHQNRGYPAPFPRMPHGASRAPAPNMGYFHTSRPMDGWAPQSRWGGAGQE